MSLIIKDMEMPTDGCKDCIFVNRKWHGDICPILKREVSGNVERGGFQTDCPLIEIKPHGRLIDADALKETFRIGMENATPLFTSGLFLSLAEHVTKALMEDIDEAPTLIEADREEETCQT